MAEASGELEGTGGFPLACSAEYLHKFLMEIPKEALDTSYNNTGFLPHIGLHRRAGVYYQESSYSHFWFFGCMLVAAGAAWLMPLDIVALGNIKLKYWIAGGIVFGGICGFVPYFIRNAYGQIVVIDPQNQLLRINGGEKQESISWRNVVGLQVCHQKDLRYSENNGYQLNLVWRDSNGAVKRHCLLKHASKFYMVSFMKRYERLFGFKVLD